MPDLATLGPPQFESRCRYRSLRSRIAGTMGVSEPQVRERRKTSGASLSEFEPKEDGPARSLRSLCGLRLPGFEPISVRCLLVASASREDIRWPWVRIPVPLPLASLADSERDGVRTHAHRISSRDANATRIEVRRSLEPLFRPEPERRCGAGRRATPSPGERADAAKSAFDSARRFNG